MVGAKSFEIDRDEFERAFKRVRANDGAAGADGVSLEQYEAELQGNLYRLWNRMSSGSYMAPPVLRVEIPKSDGKVRPLGIPTVEDRVAQMVVKHRLEPMLEPLFDDSSYGYRPGRSAKDALRVARQNCFKQDWVLDVDIQGFFDNLDWRLLLKAVRRHTKLRWVVLYIRRWLQAPVLMPDGQLVQRERGTPQGGVVSPLLANLFLHYAFDTWMRREYPQLRFERYADDIICHCDSREEAQGLRARLEQRLQECGLTLHPVKTKIVYCADSRRREVHDGCRFDFLGYTFKPRTASSRGKVFVSFSPAVSDHALVMMRRKMRQWRLEQCVSLSLGQILEMIGPQLRGWIEYYGEFRKSTLYRGLRLLDQHLVQWVRKKYRSYRQHKQRAWDWLKRLQSCEPRLFPHWWSNFKAAG